ncbi:GNAT family N-acetyltransferase [Patescibacteria group bacterium]|nr:GNAT family N-acetyltransferase [Patescibacteria group bacterium]MCL5091650.1 GNAT family N-acetyltransferase [Patescibacteria group bacterium]
MEIVKPYYSLITPGQIAGWTPDKQQQLAASAVALINQRADGHMFTYASDEIVPFLQGAHAAAVVAPDGNELWAFGKLFPWHVATTLDGLHPVTRSAQGQIPGVVELGALAVHPNKERQGLAHRIVAALVGQYHALYPPDIPLVAVVVNDNLASHQLFSHLPGCRPIDPNQLPIDILDGWKPPSTVFRLTG